MNSNYRIPDGQSVVFDAARIIATLAVFIGHATRPDVLFDVDVSLIGRATIPVFLMISGYMTAATMSRGGSFRKKLVRRYLGLYFVVVPAIVVLYLCDLWLIAVESPIVENEKFQHGHGIWRFLRESFEALTFSGEYWRVTPMSQGLFANQAYWTVEYIMAYVAGTAAYYLLDGWQRWLAILVIAVIAGPTVVLLSPLWFAGVVCFELHRKCNLSWIIENSDHPERAPAWPKPLRAMAPVYGLVGVVLVAIFEIYGIGETAYQESKSWASYDLREHLGMAKRFAWQWALVPGLFLLMLSAKYMIHWQPSDTIKTWARTGAKYTLPIYMFHFSLLYVAHSLIADYRATWLAIDPYLVMIGALSANLFLAWVAFRYLQPEFGKIVKRIV